MSDIRSIVPEAQKSQDVPTGLVAGKICTVIDLVTCAAPVGIWFHTN